MDQPTPTDRSGHLLSHFRSAQAAFRCQLLRRPHLHGESLKSVGAGQVLRDVSLVLCTCRRLPLFRETVLSLMRNLPEMSEVGRIVVIDDNSSVADRLRMKREFPRFDFMFKSAEDAGHARGLNMMLDCVDTPLIVYWEDDCVLETCGPWLSLAQNVLNSERSIICVSFDPSIENDARCARRRVWQPGGREIAFRTQTITWNTSSGCGVCSVACALPS